MISSYEIYLYHEGTNYESFKNLGSHLIEQAGVSGVRFAVWAPNAMKVCVVGGFNEWNGYNHTMQKVNNSGIWVIFIAGIGQGELYKYEIHTFDGQVFLKADPYAFWSEKRPNTASIVYQLEGYAWKDQDWLKYRDVLHLKKPMLVYEMHLGSWRRKADGSFYTYLELAEELPAYIKELGFTHVEFLPLSEHPLDASWGYQITGYFSVTSRFGTPKDFMRLVDSLHQENIGVVMDWVPGHFCRDSHGLEKFDGTALYEYQDLQKAQRDEWGTTAFDYSKPEVVSFLISNAVFWLSVFHIDGIRVDAVASMLYLDYGKSQGNWTPNAFGGKENLEAITFLKKLNSVVFKYFPSALMIAEDSTAWPQVTAPTYLGGIGFNYKWNMGWMNDVLRYIEMDPIYKKYHHNLLTFSFMYAFSENYLLPFSHDEVVHGKKALIEKMPGDYWQKFANLRALLAYLIAHPGKKLLFMGTELAQFKEWQHDSSLDWSLLDFDMHRKHKEFISQLNKLYYSSQPLWELDNSREGFEWIDPNDTTQSIVTFLRKDALGKFIIAIFNFTPVVYEDYRIGVPDTGTYVEIFNTDSPNFGGSGQLNSQVLMTEKIKWHNREFSIRIRVPPLGAAFLKPIEIKDMEETA